jgi:glycosyltransferase involved in cell wall biosynthesis
LGEAIDCALQQTYPSIEVIVVDDGSKDNSLDIIKSYGERIVPVIKENGGQASAFNAGFARSRGEIICFLDADDLFLLEKVEHVVKVFQDHPEIGWCWDIERRINTETGERMPYEEPSVAGPWDARKLMETGAPPKIPTACSGLSFRRSTLAVALPMPELLRITADVYVKLAALGSFVGWIETKALTIQKIHGSNAYTLQDKKRRRLQGRVNLLIGIYLKERFPRLKRSALHIASWGLGRSLATGGVEQDCKPVLTQFLTALPLVQRFMFLAKSAYWTMRAFAGA